MQFGANEQKAAEASLATQRRSQARGREPSGRSEPGTATGTAGLGRSLGFPGICAALQRWGAPKAASTEEPSGLRERTGAAGAQGRPSGLGPAWPARPRG